MWPKIIGRLNFNTSKISGGLDIYGPKIRLISIYINAPKIGGG